MATITKDIILWRQSDTGGSPGPRTFPEAASQTFVKGELVYLASGYLTECGDDPALILGVAGQDAHNSTAGAYADSVFLATEDSVFEANIVGSAGADYTSLATNVGAKYGIYRDTTNGRVHIDSSDTTNTRVIVLGFARGSAIGDVNARVYFKFLPDNVHFRKA